MKKTLSIVLFLVASYLLLTSFMMFSSTKIVGHSLENSKSINLVFLKAKSFIDNYKTEKNSYPSAHEFKEWSLSLPEDNDLYYSVSRLNYSQNNYPEEAIDLFGKPTTKNHYLLFLWRNEWFEYYPSWKEKGTLPSSISDYYYFDSMSKDVSASLLLSFILALIAWLVYPKTLNKLNKT